MQIRYHILLAVVAASAIIGGGYWLGNTAYQDGVRAGISAVVEQCAHQHTTIYNGITGDVMVCDGGHITSPQKTPENALPEPPEAPAGDAQHGSIPDHMEENKKPENI